MSTDAAAPVEAGSPDDAQLARQVAARSLEQQLTWLRRSKLLLPMEVLWIALGWRAGIDLPWLAAWTAARAAIHIVALWLARRWAPLVEGDAELGLRRTLWVFGAAGCTHAALLAGILATGDDTARLLAMLLTTSYSATVVICVSGQQRTYWVTVLPSYAVLVLGWAIWRGGPLGWIITAMVLLSGPIIAMSIEIQRRGLETLVRLADERERLAASLAAARDRAEAAAAARTRFFAAASHDLRQPLHALSVNATTLDLLAQRSGDARLMGLGESIGRALAQSQGLLDALLDISRLDAGAVRLHLADVDVAALLQQLHDEHEPLAAQRGLAMQLDLGTGPAWARTDADLLRRLLRNLLDNALKFTEVGGVRLALTRHAADAGGDALRILVQDSGCGIAPDDRPHVFEEFFQASNPTRDRSRGLGLGLAIVQRTAGLLGAQVQLLPDDDRDDAPPGCRFSVLLPALPGTGPAPHAAPAPALAAGGKVLSLLIVDDEPDILQALAGLLQALGWQAHVAGGADPAAAALALATDPALVLDAAVIDHRLPGGTCTDGAELALRLRALRPALPLLVITGDVAVQWEVRRHGLRLLHKPLDGKALTQAIHAEIEAVANARPQPVVGDADWASSPGAPRPDQPASNAPGSHCSASPSIATTSKRQGGMTGRPSR